MENQDVKSVYILVVNVYRQKNVFLVNFLIIELIRLTVYVKKGIMIMYLRDVYHVE